MISQEEFNEKFLGPIKRIFESAESQLQSQLERQKGSSQQESPEPTQEQQAVSALEDYPPQLLEEMSKYSPEAYKKLIVQELSSPLSSPRAPRQRKRFPLPRPQEEDLYRLSQSYPAGITGPKYMSLNEIPMEAQQQVPSSTSQVLRRPRPKGMNKGLNKGFGGGGGLLPRGKVSIGPKVARGVKIA